MKSYMIAVAASIGLTLLFMMYRFTENSALAMINSMSITSLVLLTAGCILFILEGGFLHGIAYSFKRYFKKTAKAVMEEIEEDDDTERKTHSFSVTYPFLVVGTALFLITLGMSVLFFP